MLRNVKQIQGPEDVDVESYQAFRGERIPFLYKVPR